MNSKEEKITYIPSYYLYSGIPGHIHSCMPTFNGKKCVNIIIYIKEALRHLFPPSTYVKSH